LQKAYSSTRIAIFVELFVIQADTFIETIAFCPLRIYHLASVPFWCHFSCVFDHDIIWSESQVEGLKELNKKDQVKVLKEIRKHSPAEQFIGQQRSVNLTAPIANDESQIDPTIKQQSLSNKKIKTAKNTSVDVSQLPIITETPPNWKSLKVSELKAECEKRGILFSLSKRSLKSELVFTLEEWDRSHAKSEQIKGEMQDDHRQTSTDNVLLHNTNSKATAESDANASKDNNLERSTDFNRQMHLAAISSETQLRYAYAEKLKDLKSKTLKTILSFNKQPNSGGLSDLQHRVADMLMYGAIPACPTCNSHSVLFDTNFGFYQCTALLQWSKCDFQTIDIKRIPPKLPFEQLPDEAQENEFLINFKFHPRQKPVPSHQFIGEYAMFWTDSFNFHAIQSQLKMCFINVQILLFVCLFFLIFSHFEYINSC